MQQVSKSITKPKKINLTRGKSAEGIWFQLFNAALLVITVFIAVVPLLMTIIFSLKTSQEFHGDQFWTLPLIPHFANYSSSFSKVLPNMFNSIVISLSITAGAVILSFLTAYVFARVPFPGRRVLFSLLLSLMMVPSILTMTPLYRVIISLGLKDNWLGLIVPAISGHMIGTVFIFKTFLEQQPREIFESGRIDGASEVRMCFQMAFPLALPIIGLYSINIFSASYNDYIWGFLIMETTAIKPLMPVLGELARSIVDETGQYGTEYALYLIAGLPLIIVTFLGLKYSINGDMASGMKL